MRKSIIYGSEFIVILLFLLLPTTNHELITTHAIEDPLSVPNNRFGIHIISPSFEEASEAAQLVNSSGGNWGYITFVIESHDKKKDKWQKFFDILRRKHLIPIVRLATKPSGNMWEAPSEKDAESWASFLNELIWPVKNRYVVVYNEPNHASEWGGRVDPALYAKTLNQTIDVLKLKSDDFFVLNAGLDASSPHESPKFYDERRFLTEMNDTVPGIFDKLDGWVSHSYPNPGFVGPPNGFGRGTVRTFLWEKEILNGLGLKKNLPVFITETGWKHSNGTNIDSTFPSPEKVGQNFKVAFENAWNNLQVLAVTPFILNYSQPPFDHFSFKKISPNKPDYFEHYQILVDLPKTAGKPKQNFAASLVKGNFYPSIAIGQEYFVPLTFKNTGQSIWNDQNQIKIAAILGGEELNFSEVLLLQDKKIEPGQDYTFGINIKSSSDGRKALVLNLFNNEKEFDSPSLQFDTEAKAPVSLLIKATLDWKDNPEGSYILQVDETLNKGIREVVIDSSGSSQELQAYDLLPDYNFTFTLKKRFYKPKTLNVKTKSGLNELDFGKLELDVLAILLNPIAFLNMINA